MLSDGLGGEMEELEKRVYALENRIFMYNAENESLARYIIRLEEKYAKLADRIDELATGEIHDWSWQHLSVADRDKLIKDAVK